MSTETYTELKQKYLKLEQDNEAYKQSEQEACEIIAELKAENEQLKEDKLYVCTFNERLIQKVGRYRQTLQEIKAIAEECMGKDRCYDCKYSFDCFIEDAVIPTYDICKLLIQKITKAEEE